MGIINVDLEANRQILITYSTYIKYLRKKWQYNEEVRHIFIDLKKAYDSVSNEAIYNILMEFGIPMKLVLLIKTCLSETHSIFRVGLHLSDILPSRNGLKQSVALSALLFSFALEYGISRVQVNQDRLKLSGTH